jgi:TatD DNase family protein
MQFDVHAHLDLYKNRDEVIKKAEQHKIYVVSMTNLPELYEKYIREYPSLSYVRFALGLHPELVKDYANQFPLFLSLFSKARYIGEIGLDYSKPKSDDDKRLQRQVFEQIIDNCKRCSDPKILSVHSRNAANEIIEIIGRYHGQVILHWLSDRNVKLNEAIDNGYYFSINKQMASYQSGQKLIRKIPINRLLIESDAPFTKGNNPSYAIEQLADTVKQLAFIFGVSLDEINNTLSDNFRRLLRNEGSEV